MSAAAGHDEQIEELLRQGLDDYGAGDVDAAVAAWRQVLQLDPQHPDALDYIDAAGSTSQTDIAAELPDALDPLVEDVMTLVAGGKFEAAFDLLGGDDDLPLEQAALKDLLRARLTERYRGALDLSSVPVISAAPDRIQGTDLPPDAGFLLSLLDGHTQLADVVSLSGMDPFAAFRLVRGLVAAQLVELRA